ALGQQLLLLGTRRRALCNRSRSSVTHVLGDGCHQRTRVGPCLLILPPNMALALGVSLAPSSRSPCSSVVALANLPIPQAASGTTLSWQGLVFDQGVPACTRALEMTVQ